MGEQVGEPKPISPRRRFLGRITMAGVILAGSVLKPEDQGKVQVDHGTELRPPDPKLPPTGKPSK